MRTLASVIALSLAASAAPASAVVLAPGGLQDASFESQGGGATLGNGYCYFQASSGAPTICGNEGDPWYGASGLIQSGSGPWGSPPAQDGSYFSFVQGGGYLAQDFVAVGSGRFTLTWADYGRTNNPGSGNQSYTVDISPTSVAALTSFITAGPALLTSGPYGPATGAWTSHSADFFLTDGQSYTLTFQGLSGEDVTAFIDGLSLAPSAVPEPAQWALLIGGFAFAGAALRRRRPASVLA